MSQKSTHDRYIYLQVKIKELEAQGKDEEGFGYLYHILQNKVDKIINDAINQGVTEIVDFQNLLRTVKEKQETE